MSSSASSKQTTPTPPASSAPSADLNLRQVTDLFMVQEQTIRRGGGTGAIARQHEKGRLTARERINLLVDGERQENAFAPFACERFMELGTWAAYGMYPEAGGAPAAGVVTGIGRVSGHTCMIIANDATVKAGAFFPMTCKKIIRAQTVAMMSRMPLVYLVDSAGVFLPMQEDVFPDTDDFGRIFRNNAVISAEGIPQIAAIMGFCVAGGGYLPVLCDTLLMTEGSGLYLAGQALVKAAIGQDVSDEDLGGAKMHATISGTIDFREKDDPSCIERLRSLMSKYPPESDRSDALALSRMLAHMVPGVPERDEFREGLLSLAKKRLEHKNAPETLKKQILESSVEEVFKRLVKPDVEVATAEAFCRDLAEAIELYEKFRGPRADSSVNRLAGAAFKPGEEVYKVFTDKPGTQYDVRDLIACFVDVVAEGSKVKANFDEYKAEYGQSIVCGYAQIGGHACGIVANQKKVSKSGKGQVQMGGVIYDDSADKAARFIMDCNQRKIPIVFMHDTSGFMVGRESEQGGIIRAGAKMVNAMSNCVVPKIVLITGSSYGAGNYAMCGRAFDPYLTLAWPGSKCAVMGANQASGTLAMIEERSRERKGEKIDEATHAAILAAVKASYNEQQDIRHGAARGWVDRLIEPHRTREELIAALGSTVNWDYSKPFKVGVLQT
ncbi:MAG: acyl-CoA carboxylase subunit beta [Phycisphaerales bacterium]|nr:acyl-CoA carboxylase subunit beta [Phycisphaerales bacterium]